MKKMFAQYVRNNDYRIESVISDSIIVFDTNVLLNFYRYSSNTSEQLKKAFINYKDQIWLPYHVLLEFFNNRQFVIDEQIKNYDEPIKSLRKLKKSFGSKKGHPFMEDSLFDAFNLNIDKTEKDFNKQKKVLSSLIFKDTIVDSLLEIFDNKVGNPYTNLFLKKMYQEAERRYEENIPPGYKDSFKPSPRKYGDFVVWSQMIDKSALEKKSIVFISDDQKEDWVSLYSSKSVGLLPELAKEFNDLTGNFFIFSKLLILSISRIKGWI